MKHEDIDSIVFMTIIIGRKQKDALLSALLEAGVHLIYTKYGKGTVKASSLRHSLGLVPEEHKAVITCILKQGKAPEIYRMLAERFSFSQPNTGIAFTMPIDRLSY